MQSVRLRRIDRKGEVMGQHEKIAGLLKVGRDNAIPMNELLKLTGYKSGRGLREQIDRERRNGTVICSDERGYWLPGDRSEIEKFVQRMQKSARKIFLDAQSAVKALETLPGQTELSDFLEGGEDP